MCSFSYVYYFFICTYALYFCLWPWPYLCAALHLLMKSVKVLRVSLSVPVLLSICLLLLVWPFTFTDKSVWDKINLELSVISIITILVSYAVCLSLLLSSKDMHFITQVYYVTCAFQKLVITPWSLVCMTDGVVFGSETGVVTL